MSCLTSVFRTDSGRRAASRQSLALCLLRSWAMVIAVLATALLSAAPARADDISATARGVVRVVTIAIVDDEVVGFGHGSGFAVAPNRIVTNAHVVELLARYPGNVVIGIVPSEGSKSYQGKVIALDTVHDLALIEFAGKPIPTTAIYTGPVDEGSMVTALGYPGNVDMATAKSAVDYIHPLSPIRSEGVFSGRRQMSGTAVLLHTAQIARGGPITVTHPDIVRYFMTIPEAAQLVLQAGLMGKSGQIFVLDMGEPMKIVELARMLIRLSGRTEQEISIAYTGLRPGEKLYEELLADDETTEPTQNPKLRVAKTSGQQAVAIQDVIQWIESAGPAPASRDVRAWLCSHLPEYKAQN